jgi:hypothetical protein
MLDEVLGQFADYGLEPDQPLIFGKLTRCKTTQDKGKEKNGWYVVHEHRTEKGETLIFGSFGDWRSGETQKIKVTAGRMIEAVSVVAHDHAFHPVREYLHKLEWDRVPRLESWLTDVMGVQASDYSAKVGKRWMLSAVGRVMRPGCKADSVMILEGAQGAGKSTAMSILGGEWFMDTPFALGDKDGFQAIRGKWIVEFATPLTPARQPSPTATTKTGSSVTFTASYPARPSRLQRLRRRSRSPLRGSSPISRRPAHCASTTWRSLPRSSCTRPKARW